MDNYETTLVDTLNKLKSEGYIEDFNLKENQLVCSNGKHVLFHDDFHIDKVFRFEGETNPSDEAILYAISSEKYKLKGVLINAYGIYSDSVSDEMLQKLKC